MGSKTYTPTPSTQHTLEKFVFAKRVQRSLEMRHLSEKIFENKLWRKSVRSVECEANDQSSIQTRTFSIYFEKRKSKYCHTRTLDDRMTFQNWCVSVISNKMTLDSGHSHRRIMHIPKLLLDTRMHKKWNTSIFHLSRTRKMQWPVI